MNTIQQIARWIFIFTSRKQCDEIESDTINACKNTKAGTTIEIKIVGSISPFAFLHFYLF